LIKQYIKIENRVPTRLIHGDPKISNFIFTKDEKRVQSIIDLDTVGKGSVLYDFGDMVRSFTNRYNEDEQVKESVLDQEVLIAIYNGYLSSSNSFLTKLELNSLELAGRTVCLVQAIRFYTDYILGDIYYTVKSETENLIRAKNQFQLFKELMEVELKS
jgi:Ser/Thr protein kinase RdoA (MazF antagonist)